MYEEERYIAVYGFLLDHNVNYDFVANAIAMLDLSMIQDYGLRLIKGLEYKLSSERIPEAILPRPEVSDFMPKPYISPEDMYKPPYDMDYLSKLETDRLNVFLELYNEKEPLDIFKTMCSMACKWFSAFKKDVVDTKILVRMIELEDTMEPVIKERILVRMFLYFWEKGIEYEWLSLDPNTFKPLKKMKIKKDEQVILGDCLSILKTMEENSVDSIITDPPYGLSKQPDIVEIMSHWVKGEYVSPKSTRGFKGHLWDSFVPAPDIWKECFRVLKPGGTALVFAGSRTQDLMTISMRFGGFHIKDTILWLHSQGFPKAADISKQLDKKMGKKREVIGRRKHPTLKDTSKMEESANAAHGVNMWAREWDVTAPATEMSQLWNGWRSHGLKPAFEPIIVAVKPNEGSYADNALKHGVSGFWIDGCRVPLQEGDESQIRTLVQSQKSEKNGWGMNQNEKDRVAQVVNPEGRFPTNVLHDGSEEVLSRFPHTKSGKMKAGTVRANREGYAGAMPEKTGKETIGDSGSASRFFYCAKASTSEKGKFNKHSTVKPLKLMEYLCKLTKTPTGGLVLDPFAGSGTTGLACREVGRPFVLIEKEEEYVEIIKKRLEQ